MQFESVAAALAMDGHGSYVWTVALVTLLIISGMLLLPVLRSRRYITEQRGALRREHAETQTRERTDASGT